MGYIVEKELGTRKEEEPEKRFYTRSMFMIAILILIFLYSIVKGMI